MKERIKALEKDSLEKNEKI